jgi:pimeloyl-ACP methyl ester carboxylesterase
MSEASIQKIRLSGGNDLAYRCAGNPGKSALVLLHGLPNSSRGFRDVMEPLSRSAFVVAPDLPGFGDSDPLPQATFAGFAGCIEELLLHLKVGQRFIYLHDFGAPVGLQLAILLPHQRGLVRRGCLPRNSLHRPASGRRRRQRPHHGALHPRAG